MAVLANALESLRAFGAVFANARLRYLAGVGHFTPVECPHDFAEALAAAANVPFP